MLNNQQVNRMINHFSETESEMSDINYLSDIKEPSKTKNLLPRILEIKVSSFINP